VIPLLTLYGIDVGLKYNRLNETSKLVKELSNTSMPVNRPFIGDMAYDIESGIVTNWYRNAFHQYPTEVFPVHPDFVGHSPPQILMGKYSGVDKVALWSEELGISLQNQEAQVVLNEVKRRAYALKRVLNKDEFREIVEDVRKQTISLIS